MSSHEEKLQRFSSLYSGNYDKSAFRLELLPTYAVKGEDEGWEKFLNGQIFPNDANQKAVVETIKVNAERGLQMSRIHVMRELSPYIQYEMQWGYFYTQAAGEDIYFLHEAVYKQLITDEFRDFWIFDDKIVVQMHYTDDYRFEGVDFVEDKNEVNKYIAVRETLMLKAISLHKFLSSLRRESIPWPSSLT